MKKNALAFLKGLGIGAANIIPGVSGGTIALLTGIFERLINAIKAFDVEALKLFFSGRFSAFAKHTDLPFLLSVIIGALTGIYSLTFVLDPLLENHPRLVWAFFFGLILATLYYVSKKVERWQTSTFIAFGVGTLIAILMTVVLKPGLENANFGYLLLCGALAICSMILPGLSGSDVLFLMGNYKLVLIDGMQAMDLKILVPFGLGAIFGILAFSRVLSWVLKKYKNVTIALLTGFILGPLGMLWPWKNELMQNFEGKEKVVGYQWFWPTEMNSETLIIITLMLLGSLFIVAMEQWAAKYKK